MDQKKGRLVATLIYLIALSLTQWMVVGAGFPINEKLLWFANGAASLLLGSRLLNPHFVPPADVATNAFVAAGTLVAALAAAPGDVVDVTLIWLGIAVSVLCFVAATTVLLLKKPKGGEGRRWLLAIEKTAKAFGAPRVIFTFIILIVTWVFHRPEPLEIFSILTLWTVIVALDPIESLLDFISWLNTRFVRIEPEVLGEVAAYQLPGLVLLRQSDDARHPLGTLFAISDDKGPTTLGVALNYVGRDDGVLLRALSLPVPPALRDKVEKAAKGTGLATPVEVDEDQIREVLVYQRISALCGIVDSDSDIEFIEIEVVDDRNLEEGALVDVKIRSQYVVYQIIAGVTHEDLVQQKNKFGYVRVKARKIGTWDADGEKFVATSWLPSLNAPVFSKNREEFQPSRKAIGNFPGTSYPVGIDISSCVTHNTAILGILGIGKSYLAIELVERMLGENIKVICLDLTDQYASLLTDFYDEKYHAEVISKLHVSADGEPVAKGKERGGSVHAFRIATAETIHAFLSDTKRSVLILNPAEFSVSKQTTNAYGNDAAFASLSPAEITAIISDETLTVCQAMGMTDKARVCLVYEEAHSLVPEWNSVVNEGDKAATSQSARAILQGRKFGLGCLLITQRTANVTKTILNQCNSIFAMRTFDDTGRDFLGNYIGKEYARILPTLRERHAVFFGKASTCDDPVLIRLNDRENFLSAYRKQDSEEA